MGLMISGKELLSSILLKTNCLFLGESGTRTVKDMNVSPTSASKVRGSGQMLECIVLNKVLQRSKLF